MSRRFRHLEGINEEAAPTAAPASWVETSTRRAPVFSRLDLEIWLFALSAGMLAGLGTALHGDSVEYVAAAFLFGFFAVTLWVYGVRVLNEHGTVRGTGKIIQDFRAPAGPRLADEQSELGETENDAEEVLESGKTREALWRSALLFYLLAIKLARGASIRDLTLDKKDRHGRVIRRKYMTGTTWRKMNPVARRNGLVEDTPEGTRLAMVYGKAVIRVKWEVLSLPEDQDEYPPARVLIW